MKKLVWISIAMASLAPSHDVLKDNGMKEQQLGFLKINNIFHE